MHARGDGGLRPELRRCLPISSFIAWAGAYQICAPLSLGLMWVISPSPCDPRRAGSLDLVHASQLRLFRACVQIYVMVEAIIHSKAYGCARVATVTVTVH